MQHHERSASVIRTDATTALPSSLHRRAACTLRRRHKFRDKRSQARIGGVASEGRLCSQRSELVSVRHRQALPKGRHHRRDIPDEPRNFGARARQEGILDAVWRIA